MNTITVGKYRIALTNTDKVLFPADGITKGDIIHYYADIAPIMLPYCKDHPISMLRYPNGINHEGFYQKDTPDYFPAWIKRVKVPKENKELVSYTVIQHQETLVYLANQGCLTPHIWLSKAGSLDYPDRMIFDLDPSVKNNFSAVRATAYLLKEFLEDLHLVPFIMTTGSEGLHVVVPLKQQNSFDEVRTFARTVAEMLVRHNPTVLTTEVRIKSRGRKIFIDYLRNAFSATAVAPYAVRHKPKAPVATPLFWEELADKKLFSAKYTINSVMKKIERDGNPWSLFYRKARTIKKAQKLLDNY